MVHPSARIAAIAPSKTMAVDAKAKALQAEGRSVISFGAGEPDFPTPEHIVEAAVAAARDPKNHHYTAAAGLPTLRQAIADKTACDAGLTVQPSQVVVTNGGKQAVYQAFATLINDGDEVLLPSPYWTTYPESIALAGGHAVEVFAGADQDYKVTVDQLDAARTERTRGFVFVSPSNPTGAVYSTDEIAALGQWLLANDLWVVTDEIYQSLTYDGVVARSIVDVVPELAGQTILVNGVAKSYAMTGWRIGWMVAAPELAEAAATLQSHLCSNVNNIAQVAAVAALTGPQEPVEQMRQAFARRRTLILEQLRSVPGVEVPTPDGAFYVYADVRAVLGDSWDGVRADTSLELADLLLDRAGVAAVPGEAFGPSGYLRFSYALGDEAIVEGIGRLRDFVASSS
ncbi:aminotransferase [Microlunatus endophyticus]|uniref:Aminotransferase n=1 Tax=Microlunatus endophyticus TaxID=1716077 RepID=A0A917S011_9ACTN|nr:pyridoxal phosphate-dependent aminotransferase [Microlunatus endophyticus]GGL49022.1 aminotransferase [Microlunatus endophyticus]